MAGQNTFQILLLNDANMIGGAGGSLIKTSSIKRSSSLSSTRSNLGFLPICFSFQSAEQQQSELIIKTNNNNTLGASYLVGAR